MCKHYFKSPTPELAGYFSVNYSPCIITQLKRLCPFGQNPFQVEYINEVHLLIPEYSALVSIPNNLLQESLGALIQKPPVVVAQALTSSMVVTQQPLHLQPCGLLVPCSLFTEGVREDRPHEITEGEVRTCQQTTMVLTAERSLFGEARPECEDVHNMCFGFVAQSSLQLLPDQDTCQVSSGAGIAKLFAFKGLVHLDGKLQAQRKNNFRVGLQMLWLDMWIYTSLSREAYSWSELQLP